MESKTEKYLNIISKIVFPFIILAGFEILVFEICGHHAVKPIVLIVTAASVIYNQAADKKAGKEKLILAEICFLIIYIIISFTYFKSGIASVFNGLMESLENVKPYNYVMFSTGSKNLIVTETVFLSWIAIASGAGITRIINRGSKKAIYILAFLWMISVITFNKNISSFSLILSSISIAMLIFHNRLRKGTGSVEDTLPGDFHIMFRIVCIAIVITGLFTVFLPEEKYEKPEIVQNAENFVRETVSAARYGSNKEMGLTDGRVYEAGEIKRNRDPVLEIKMDKPESYYFRGFTGGIYEDSQWKSVDNHVLSQNKELFYWLHKNDFYDFNQLAFNSLMEGQKETNNITVRNLNGSRKYMYVPYEVVDGNNIFDIKRITDGSVTAKGIRGEKEYSLETLPNQVKRYQNLAQNLIENADKEKYEPYIMNESYYNQFVYDNYTDVPENIYSVLYDYLGDYELSGNNSHFEYQMAKQNIMYFMTNKMEYSEKVKPTGRDIDFILEFIEGRKTGYDAHFASAATMMFRYYGIPARYVEGFIVTKKDAERMKPGETKVLDKRNAHAWVEYYHDGIGWVPFEVTPSYVGKMDSPEQLKDISSLVGTKSPDKSELEDQYEEQEENKDRNFESILIKNKMIIILAVLSILVLILLTMFIGWIIRERRKTSRRIASFDVDDVSKGIQNIFDYAIDLIIAYGMKPEEGCLEKQIPEIARLMGNDFTDKYNNAIGIFQEAKYSSHNMSENERKYVRDFMNEIKCQMDKDAGFIQKLKYKYMYFL